MAPWHLSPRREVLVTSHTKPCSKSQPHWNKRSTLAGEGLSPRRSLPSYDESALPSSNRTQDPAIPFSPYIGGSVMRSSRWSGLVLLAFCAVMVLFIFVTAAAAQVATAPTKEFKAAPNLWFVELNSLPAVEAGRVNKAYINSLKNEKASFRAAAKAARITFTERYAYHQLWNGLAVK